MEKLERTCERQPERNKRMDYKQKKDRHITELEDEYKIQKIKTKKDLKTTKSEQLTNYHHFIPIDHHSLSTSSSLDPATHSSLPDKNITTRSKKIKAFLFSHMGLAVMVMSYSVMGGLLFQALEGSAELQEKDRVRFLREDTAGEIMKLAMHFNIHSLDHNVFAQSIRTVLTKYQKEIVAAVKQYGFNGKIDSEDSSLQWSFPGSLLYAVTVITTIGYGHVVPKTIAGRMVTILYALVGIPLTFLYLSNMGNFAAQCFRLFYKKVCCGICIYVRLASHKRRMNKVRQNAEAHVRNQEAFNSIVESTFMSTRQTAFFSTKRRATSPLVGNVLEVTAGSNGRLSDKQSGSDGKKSPSLSLKLLISRGLRRSESKLNVEQSLSQQFELGKGSKTDLQRNEKSKKSLQLPVIENVASGNLKRSSDFEGHFSNSVTSVADLPFTHKRQKASMNNSSKNEKMTNRHEEHNIEINASSSEASEFPKNNETSLFKTSNCVLNAFKKFKNKKEEIPFFSTSSSSKRPASHDGSQDMAYVSKKRKNSKTVSNLLSSSNLRVNDKRKLKKKHSFNNFLFPPSEHRITVGERDKPFSEIQSCSTKTPSIFSSSVHKKSFASSSKELNEQRDIKKTSVREDDSKNSSFYKVSSLGKIKIPVLKVTNSHENLYRSNVFEENMFEHSLQNVCTSAIDTSRNSPKCNFATGNQTKTETLKTYLDISPPSSNSHSFNEICEKKKKYLTDQFSQTKMMETSFESSASTSPFLKPSRHSSPSDQSKISHSVFPYVKKSLITFVRKKVNKKNNNVISKENKDASTNQSIPLVRNKPFFRSKSCSDLNSLETHLKKINSILLKDPNKNVLVLNEALSKFIFSSFNDVKLSSKLKQVPKTQQNYFTNIKKILSKSIPKDESTIHSKHSENRLRRKILKSNTFSRLRHKRRKNKDDTEGEEEIDYMKMTVPISVCLMIIALYIYLGSLLFSFWEGWDLMTSSYFCFITLSTIGFGDIVPGIDSTVEGAHQKLLLCSLWLVVGLSLLAMCFNLMQEEVKEKFTWLGKKLGILRQ